MKITNNKWQLAIIMKIQVTMTITNSKEHTAMANNEYHQQMKVTNNK